MVMASPCAAPRDATLCDGRTKTQASRAARRRHRCRKIAIKYALHSEQCSTNADVHSCGTRHPEPKTARLSVSLSELHLAATQGQRTVLRDPCTPNANDQLPNAINKVSNITVYDDAGVEYMPKSEIEPMMESFAERLRKKWEAARDMRFEQVKKTTMVKPDGLLDKIQQLEEENAMLKSEQKEQERQHNGNQSLNRCEKGAGEDQLSHRGVQTEDAGDNTKSAIAQAFAAASDHYMKKMEAGIKAVSDSYEQKVDTISQMLFQLREENERLVAERAEGFKGNKKKLTDELKKASLTKNNSGKIAPKQYDDAQCSCGPSLPSDAGDGVIWETCSCSKCLKKYPGRRNKTRVPES